MSEDDFRFKLLLLYIIIVFISSVCLYFYLSTKTISFNISDTIIDFFTSDRIKNLEHRIKYLEHVGVGDQNFASWLPNSIISPNLISPKTPSPFNVSSNFLLFADKPVQSSTTNISGLNAYGEPHNIEPHNNMSGGPQQIKCHTPLILSESDDLDMIRKIDDKSNDTSNVKSNIKSNDTSNVAKIKSVTAIPPTPIPKVAQKVVEKIVEKVVYVEKKDHSGGHKIADIII